MWISTQCQEKILFRGLKLEGDVQLPLYWFFQLILVRILIGKNTGRENIGEQLALAVENVRRVSVREKPSKLADHLQV